MYQEINILGLTRESSETINMDLKKIMKAFESFKKQNIFIIESDSTDKTIEELEKISSQKDNISFESYGQLALKIPNKIERLCFLRNELLNYLKQIKPTEYVVFVDLDNINNKITKKSVESCFQKNNWSGCFANQEVGYYDIFALRANNWNSVDCFAEIYKDNINSFSYIQEDFQMDYLFEKHVLKKMRKIKKDSEWIEVNSAFGGIGIYKYEDIKNNFYDLTPSKSEYEYECEHVNFNNRIIENGGKLFINPGFINSKYNEHNKRLKKRFLYLDKLRRFNTLRKDPFNL